MKKLIFPLCALSLLLGCISPAAITYLLREEEPDKKFLSPDYAKPRKLAVLPMDNQTVDVEAPPVFRELLHRYLRRSKYTGILEPSSVDSLLNEEGITDAGQLPSIENEELFEILDVDGLLFLNLLKCSVGISLFGRPAIKVNLKMVTPPSNLVWESERLRQADFGNFIPILWTRLKYALKGVDDHPLMAQMDDILVGSLKTMPGYIDRNFPAVIVGLDAGYLSTLGKWNKHRFAPGVDQLHGGPRAMVEIEKKYTLFGVGLGIGYGMLDVSDWEEYAAAKGDAVEAAAAFYHIDLMLKIYPLVGRWNILKLESGISFFKPYGDEKYLGETYAYDFLKTSAGYIFGFEYDRFIGDVMAVPLRVRYRYVEDAIEYAEGSCFDWRSLSITTGIRFYF